MIFFEMLAILVLVLVEAYDNFILEWKAFLDSCKMTYYHGVNWNISTEFIYISLCLTKFLQLFGIKSDLLITFSIKL